MHITILEAHTAIHTDVKKEKLFIAFTFFCFVCFDLNQPKSKKQVFDFLFQTSRKQIRGKLKIKYILSVLNVSRILYPSRRFMTAYISYLVVVVVVRFEHELMKTDITKTNFIYLENWRICYPLFFAFCLQNIFQ